MENKAEERNVEVMYQRYFKRILDVVLSSVAIFFLSPLLIILAVWIRMDSRGPILFKQKRIGKNKTYFWIWKFRTMYADTPENIPTHLLKNADARITKCGKFLRHYSLDELPQLFNILNGDMSIVGPRPALWNQYDLIAARDRYHANDVLPGLTGYAQAHGRDELPIPVKAKMDGFYVKHLSFFMDIKIILDTMQSVIHGNGVVEGAQFTEQYPQKSPK